MERGAGTATSNHDLGRRAARGALATLLGQGARIAVQLIGLVVLARMLEPEDFGLLAMVTAVIGIGEVLRDAGLSSASIQAESVSREQRSNLFWINTGIGALLSVVTLFAASGIAALYSDDRLTVVAQALSVTFILTGMSTQPRADLLRRLRFGAVATVDVSAQTLGLGLAIILAVHGAGIMALVAQQIAIAAIGTVLIFAFARYRPGMPSRGTEMGLLLRYGGNYTGTQLLGYISRNVDSLVIGQALGPITLGYYNRAFQLLSLPLNQLSGPATNVALPVLSRLQSDPKRYAAFLLRGQLLMLHVVAVIFTFSCAFAQPLIVTALGAQWAPSVPLFQILAVGGLFQAASFSTYWVFVSQGKMASNLRFAVVTRTAVVMAVVIGIQLGGVTGVAIAYSGSLVLLWPLGLWWLGYDSAVPRPKMIVLGLRTISAHALAAVASSALVLGLAGLDGGAALVAGLAAMSLFFAMLTVVCRPLRRDLATVILSRRLLKGM